MSILDELHKNRELFIQFNDLKYKRFQQLIASQNIRRVVNAIPLLLSVNNKRLPGYIEGDVPFGIVNYRPETETVKYIQGRFITREIELNTAGPFIEMMAVMGSVGTIAYTKDSDFDYWVCIDKHGVSDAKLENFQKKVDAVQSWAMEEIDIEVNIFINDITNIKRNIFAESKEEAFGSIIGAVLKDEFFRSSIIIAGKIPFWWVLPRFVRDGEYETLYNSLPREDKETRFVDLGNLYEISKEDFVGAALFLIIKSLGNPFKSIIKLGLLEKYLFGPDNSPLLCQKIKSSIFRGNVENKILDSYILMFEEVYDYYESALADKTLLKILRQNLYLKIDPQLSRYIGVKDRQNIPYKVLVMFKYVKAWGWSGKDVQALDNFEQWDYNRTMVFWNMVKKFMLLSYQKIVTQIPMMKLEQKVSESDFKLLSGKIKTHFAQEKNKIDHYITFKDTPHESMIFIDPAAGKGMDDDEWSLSKKSGHAEEKASAAVLRTEKGLVKLIAWAAINGIFNPNESRLRFQSGLSRVNQNTVVDLMGRIATLFSGTMSKLKNEYYLRPAFNMVNMVIINFGIENAERIQTIHHIYQTSWGESYIDDYGAADDLIPILGTIVQEGAMSNRGYDEYCVIIAPEPFKKHYKEIEQIFKEAYEFITRRDKRFSCRYVARLGGIYLTVSGDGDAVSIHGDPDIVKTMMRISLNPRNGIAYSFYSADPRLRILDAIYKIRKKSNITVVFEESGDTLLTYLVNEAGNIFIFIRPKALKEESAIYLFDFCQNIMNRVNTRQQALQAVQGIQLFQITVDRFGKFTFENKTQWVEESYLVKYKAKKAIAVKVSGGAGNDPLYSVAVSGDEPSGMMPMQQVPRHIDTLMTSDRRIVPFINDITIADERENESSGTTPYCYEKYRLELIIDKSRK